MRLIVVRHYKTLINAARQIMGWGDAPRVLGWESDLAFVDGELEARGVPIDAVYSSYLERSRQTAMYYARRRDIPMIRDAAELNEVNYGPHLFRKEKSWVAEHFPLHKRDPDFVYPDGESFRQMQRRSVDYILSLEPYHRHDTLLLVLHAGVIRGLVCEFLHLEYASNLKRRVGHRYIGDMQVEGRTCLRYDELGRSSGFVTDGVIQVPWTAPEPRQPREETSEAVAGP